MPRPKKVVAEAVIPTTSLVASAVRYSGESARIYQPQQDWQAECYRHYAICGEARFAANFFGHAVSRATLTIEQQKNGQPHTLTSGPAVEALDALFNGADGQTQMLSALGIHLTVAGECYLVGREVNGEDVWEIVSILEMKVVGTKWSIHYGDGMADVELTDNDVVIRIWVPNPARRIEADSPFRSLLPILTEIEWLTRHIFAQTSSRLAGAGLLMLPQGMSFPPPPEVDGKPQVTTNDADSFMLTLADAMLTPIQDPSSPSAMVPIVVTAPDDAIAKAKLMHFWSNLDDNALKMRSEAIRRFALGMDLPPEQVMGMSVGAGSGSGGGGGSRSGGMSHWGAWQVEESTVKLFIEPMLELIANALTIGYLRPMLGDGHNEAVGYDSADLKLRPDRSKEAFELFDRGLISMSALLRENGFTDDDMPKPEEFRIWLLRKVASGSATPEQVEHALQRLGVDLGVPDEDLKGGTARQSRPSPSLEDHPTKPRDPMDSGPPSVNGDDGNGDSGYSVKALLAASDALVYRALERAGNRIRQKEGVKPPGVPAFKMHTLFQVNGSADKFLDDAWSCAPQVLDGLADVETTVQTLNSYVRSLFANQEPHTRDRLEKWLAKVSS